MESLQEEHHRECLSYEQQISSLKESLCQDPCLKDLEIKLKLSQNENRVLGDHLFKAKQ